MKTMTETAPHRPETPASSHPVPVFVLGLQRSGTTWISNLICAHPKAACVESEDHQGIHESIFFSHFATRYGDLLRAESFRKFADDFAASDYYILTGIENEWLQHTASRSYPTIFRELMNEFACRRGANLWVEKSPHHTLLCWQLARAFPDAKFIGVLRRPSDLVRSRLWAFGRTPPPYPVRVTTLLRACGSITLHARVLTRFSSKCSRALLIRYEDLAHDTEGTMRRVAAFLGLQFDPAMTRARYRANSSFRSIQDRQKALGAADRILIELATAAMHVLPLGILLWVASRKRARPPTWPDWVWRRRARPEQQPDA
jgi:hypothetical protein